MKKHFVLDTNVLLHDPEAMFRFKDNVVVVPIQVIEEIDHFKKELSEIGRSARTVSRHLDTLRLAGSLADGVKTDDGGTIQVHLGVELPENFPITDRNADAKILALALALKQQRKTVVFITKDTNLRVKADALGISAVDYESDPRNIEDVYRGWVDLTAPRDLLDRLFQESALAADQLGAGPLYPNQFVRLTAGGGSKSALGRYHARERKVLLLREPKPVWGIRARNMEQRFALELLLDDEISLVCLIGKAGTGKTLLALAAGLLRTVDDEQYRKLLVTRPIFPLGRDIGYLPGEIGEKLKPWMQPIFDNLELLVHLSTGEKRGRGYLTLFDQKLIEIEPLTYIRGRSIPHQFLIVDEAQNLTPHEVKTILTRAGEGTKVVLTGDPYQIDNPYVDAASNGLSHTIERFKGQDASGSILLSKGERSPLAELAANLL